MTAFAHACILPARAVAVCPSTEDKRMAIVAFWDRLLPLVCWTRAGDDFAGEDTVERGWLLIIG